MMFMYGEVKLCNEFFDKFFVFLRSMTTLTIELTSDKALKLLQDLEDLDIIRVVKKSGQLSQLRSKIKTKMSEEAIDQQLTKLRNEWQRDI